MSARLGRFVAMCHKDVESGLRSNLPLSGQRGTERFNEALEYAIFPGGKRWRPLLTLLSGSIVGIASDALIPAACALEYLHTSSIIIDDLPAMDDARMRRGKPALHLKYDESTALLVSLALLNRSYLLLADTCELTGNPGNTRRLLTAASEAIGSNGMIGGQVVDLICAKGCFRSDRLSSRNLKTTSLARLMMTVGAIAASSSEKELQALANFGNALGSAYQIIDDLLDFEGDEIASGKTLRQDERHLRPSFHAEYRPEHARRLALRLLEGGIGEIFMTFGEIPETRILAEAAHAILQFKPAMELGLGRNEVAVL